MSLYRVVRRLLPFVSSFSLVAATAVADDSWPPFTVEWRAGAPSPADVSFLLDAPAGKRGFIRVKDGHLVRPDGRQFRIWGINATGKAALPAKESAPVIAAQLAARGINCVRFHFLDQVGRLIPADRDDTRTLDPAALDRLDFFIAELKKRGIYSNLNLNVYRTYKAGDGVREHEQLGNGKGATYFDKRLIELQREYARQLLTHINTYTRLAYREEPAVAVVEFVNENSLVESWTQNRLLGKQTAKASGTWHDIPPSYAEALTKKFNVWLAGRVPAETLARWRNEAGIAADAPLPRLRKEEFAKAAKDRFEAEAPFYMEIERNFYRDMAKFLRDELGVKSLFAGNSDHGHGGSGYPLLSSLAQLDIVDGHIYWQHPNYLTDPKTGKRAGFTIGNTPMVDEPLKSSVIQLSRSAVAGKPYTVSEANHPSPNENACEGVPILAAYAALQDWDGIFWYTLAHDDVVAMTDAALSYFDFAKDPVKMSQLAAGALMFLRGDVRSAQRTVGRSYSREQVAESLRLPRSEQPYFTPGFPLALPLTHAVRITSFDGPPTGAFEPVATADSIESDTRELVWRTSGKGTGLVVVDTPLSQALVGHVAKQGGKTKNLRAEIQTPFCALTLGALDNKAVSASAKLLLTVTARVANTGMEWNAKRNSLEKWGKAPVRIEPVTGRIVLTGFAKAREVVAQPLDGGGQPLGQPIVLSRDGDGWVLDLGKPPTTWFVITLRR
ncbi:MAG: hypothetical protein HZA91_13330 [Verrucomicrobia bacterium]|nr:hypothetical protein [Verrucomicrobiota bacterium]